MSLLKFLARYLHFATFFLTVTTLPLALTPRLDELLLRGVSPLFANAYARGRDVGRGPLQVFLRQPR